MMKLHHVIHGPFFYASTAYPTNPPQQKQKNKNKNKQTNKQKNKKQKPKQNKVRIN